MEEALPATHREVSIPWLELSSWGDEVLEIDRLAGVVGKQPAPVIATPDQVLISQRGQGEADGGALRAYEVCDLSVGERVAQQHAFGCDDAGPVGQMAEDRDDALFNAGQLANRAVDREPVLLIS